MDQKTTEKILKETEAGYDLVASKFSETRKHFWRGLEFIADCVKTGDKVLDFGCGNGRLLELFYDKKIDYLGLDTSEKLINTAKVRYPEKSDNFLKVPSSGSLSLPDNSFNTVFFIAVFHHFPSLEYREKMAKELYRVTKKDGCIVITVWNLWPASTRRDDCLSTRGGQKKYIKNILKNWLLKIFGKSELGWNDCYIPFADNQNNKFQRFHHAFTKRELYKLFSDAGFDIEKCEIIDGKNIVLIGKK